MECKDCLFLFDDYIDQKLDEKDVSSISVHLKSCESCSFAYQDFRQQQEVFDRYLHNAEASPILWKNLQISINSQKAKPWWRRLFEGSVAVPTPVLAATLILVAAAFISANIIWKRSASSSEVALRHSVSTNDNFLPSTPAVVEKTKIVEVPVIKERVVTRVVYVERPKSQSSKLGNSVSATNRFDQSIAKSVKDNITVNGIAVDSGYFTKVDLSRFQPTNETKVRVIRGVEGNEK